MAVTINLPKGLDEITLEEYMNYNEKMRPHEVVQCFTGVDVTKFPKRDVDAMAEQIKEVLESNAAEFKDVIEVDGKEFGIIPDMYNVSTGAWMDARLLTDVSHLDKLMSIIYRPIKLRLKDRYILEDYEAKHLDNAVFMRELTMDIVYGAELFFCTLEKKSLDIIKSSLLKEVETQIQVMKSEIGGVGTT